MFCFLLAAISTAVVGIQADITGTNPANGDCLCVNGLAINVRNEGW